MSVAAAKLMKPWYLINPHFTTSTLPKTNMDTQNDGLEKVSPFEKWQFLVSMLDFTTWRKFYTAYQMQG